jgi:putative Ca2+/H+ antiporter (TMEM165/GDT1 family)
MWLSRIAGSLFIVFGVAAWVWGEKAEAEGRKWIEKYSHWGPFWVSLVTIAVTELGDRTQIAAGVLAAETKAPLSVFSGAMAALVTLNFLTVWVGGQLASKLPAHLIHRGAGVLFVLVGFWMLLRL